jgi:hypothetical protein
MVCSSIAGETMSSAPKTAYELAMERLRKKDADAGIVHESVTDEQKAEIAEVRRVAEARIAELKILHQSALLSVFDPGERESLEAGHRADLQRVADDRERKIARIRESRG